jgi:hypothetical protein
VGELLYLQRTVGNSTTAAWHARRQEEMVRDGLRSPARPLNQDLRAEMEGRLDADFRGVRVHEEEGAGLSARRIGAAAYTVGSDIVFAPGEYDASTQRGRETVAHELVHVLQQRRGIVAGARVSPGLTISDPSDPFEQAAAETARLAMSAPARGLGHGYRMAHHGQLGSPSHVMSRGTQPSPQVTVSALDPEPRRTQPATPLAVQRNNHGKGGVALKGDGREQKGGDGGSLPAQQQDRVAAAEAEFHELEEYCSTGTTIAWDLYRAILQLQVDLVHEKTGRMGGVGDPEVEKAVKAAGAARTESETVFKDLKSQGSAAMDRIKAKMRPKGDEPKGLAPPPPLEDVFELGKSVTAARTSIAQVSERAWSTALEVEENGHLVAARHAFKAADAAERILGRRKGPVNVRTGKSPSPGLVETGYGFASDTVVNTVFSGTYGNITSGLGLNAASHSTLWNLGTGTTYVLAPLAVLCGSIDLVLSVRGALSSRERKRQLNQLRQLLADPTARQIASFAAEQKDKKVTHRWIMSGAALAGLAAGILGCIALGVATFGVGALVIGVVAAAIGLGVLFYKIYRSSKWGKAHKIRGFAKSLIKMASDTSADEEDRKLARKEITGLGITVQNDDFAGVSDKDLAEKLTARKQSQRQEMANGLLYLLVNGARSERRDAEEVLKALKLKPEELVQSVEAGQGLSAESQIMGKLASW